ncbi:MAG: protein translocase subunit SecF [Patescibacteria group bacterium]
MQIIKNKWWFLGVSGLLVAASIGAIAIHGFKFGIDFSGGTLWQIDFEKNPTRDDLVSLVSTDTDLSGSTVTEEGESGSGVFFFRTPELTEAKHQEVANALRAQFGGFEELGFQTIGSSIGAELRSKAITAFLLVLIGISLYIAFAFRKVSRPVASWKYGIITLLTLFHDALIPAGIFAILGALKGVEVDTNFIVAILVVMGFSVHDTIVVFDRIRENIRISDVGRSDFDELVNRSVNQTMARSINTSLTLVLVLIALYFFGAPNLQYFIFAIGIGTIVGTYSSIFVASPLLTLWRKKE